MIALIDGAMESIASNFVKQGTAKVHNGRMVKMGWDLTGTFTAFLALGLLLTMMGATTPPKSKEGYILCFTGVSLLIATQTMPYLVVRRSHHERSRHRERFHT